MICFRSAMISLLRDTVFRLMPSILETSGSRYRSGKARKATRSPTSRQKSIGGHPIFIGGYGDQLDVQVLICKNFFNALKESAINDKIINLDFIYGNVDRDIFLSLDNQQRPYLIMKYLRNYAFVFFQVSEDL